MMKVRPFLCRRCGYLATGSPADAGGSGQVFQQHGGVLENTRFVLLAEVMNTTVFCSSSLRVVCGGPTAGNSLKGKAYLFSAGNTGFMYY